MNESALLIAVSRATCELLNSEDLISGLPAALKLIGEAANMDRLLVLLEQDDRQMVHRVFHEWVAPGITTHASAGLADQHNEDFPELIQRLRAGLGFWVRVSEVTGRGRENFDRLGIRTTTGFPIFVGGTYKGLLAFDDCHQERPYDRGLDESLKAVAEVIAAAMRRELLIESAARERLTELKKSTAALQASIDALRETENLDEFVPGVLNIVARTFETSSCAFFENSPAGKVRLRYWNVGGKTYLPAELAQLDPEKYALVRFLSAGFEVPDAYLGAPAPLAIGPRLIDHVAGTSVAEFDKFAIEAGWDLELNIGVAARGVRAFTLCVYRKLTNPFSEEEIALAEALAKQLGLAMETSRLAEQAREATVAQERGRRVQEQVELLKRANEALRQGAERVAQSDSLDGLLEGLLLGSMSVTGAAGGAISLWRDGKYSGTQCVAQDGQIVARKEWEEDLFFRETPEFLRRNEDDFTSRLLTASHTRETLEWAKQYWPACAEYHGKRGHVEVWNVPCVSRGSLMASLGLAFRQSREADPVLMGTLTALAQQMALGLEMARHAEQQREASTARERLAAARNRADELAKAHGVLRQSSERLTTLDDLNGFLEQITRSAVEASGAAGGGIGLVDAASSSLRVMAAVDESGPDGALAQAFSPSGAIQLEGPARTAWDQIAATEGYWWTDPEDPAFTDEFRQYHRSRGHRQIAHFRLAIQAEAIGVLTIAFRDEEKPNAPRLEMLRVLAQQASLAIALSRLAEKARDAAVFRDREAQAERTSEFLVQTATALSSGSELTTALTSVVEQLALAIGAAHLFLFRHNAEDRTLRLQLSFLEGRLRWGPSGDEMPLWANPFPDDVTPAWRLMCERRGLFTPENTPIPPEKFSWPGCFEYATNFQLSDMAHVVLFAGDSPLGSLGFGFRDGSKLRATDKHLIELAAQQATIVIRMLDLSEEARRGAVAMEREVASERRAIELAKTNVALRRTLDAVAFEPGLDDVLDAVLSAIAKQLECNSCALWMLDRETEKFKARLLLHDGRVLKNGPDFESHLKRFWGGGRNLMLQQHIRERRPVVYQVRQIAEDHPLASSFLESLGVHTLLGLPLVLGGEIIGSLTARFHVPRELSEEELELSQVMSHQATLAIQLTRMAERAGEAALIEERARFARDIHDTLAQGFTGILMQLGAASQVPGVLRTDIAPQLDAVTTLARTSLAEARRSVRALRPLAVSECRLDRTVEQFAESIRLQTSADVVFRLKGSRSEISPHVENELCRIAQESLNNAVKHAAPKRISVSVEFQGAHAVRLSVKDDGIGFDQSLRPGADSFGLIGMQERAASIGASLTIVSEGNRGTEVIVQYGKGGV